MSRLAIAGFALTFAGLIGLLSAELIGTAHAGRDADKAYLFAVSSGPALFLVRQGATDHGDGMARQVACGHLFAVGELRLGLQCRKHIKGSI
jgi:hypothetical protein